MHYWIGEPYVDFDAASVDAVEPGADFDAIDDIDDAPPELPAALAFASVVFATLRQRHDFERGYLAPAIVALAGGGGLRVLAAPRHARPLPVADIETLARLYGAHDDLLVDAVEDVIAFDAAYLSIIDARAAETLRRLNP